MRILVLTIVVWVLVSVWGLGHLLVFSCVVSSFVVDDVDDALHGWFGT